MTNYNIQKRTIFCHDNLDVLKGMNSECIDLIYLDPPFNKNKKFTAPIGSSAEGAEFSDIFREEDIKSEWLVTIKEDHPELYHYLNGIRGVGNPYNFAYLAYMAIRLIECERVLKQSGSIYLHCDPTMSHYLKSLMDCVFGERNFRNEVVWDYTFRLMDLPRFFNRKHDLILFYAKGRNALFSMPKEPWTREEIIASRKQKIHFSEDGEEMIWMPGRKGKSKSRLKKLNDIIREGKAISDVWKIPIISSSAKERTGYPTQKPLALLDRIIKASSNEGDMVLDPFCGCATTCVAADNLGRQWIGIDISIKAYDLVRDRLTDEVANPGNILQFKNRIHLKTSPPRRTDLDRDYREQKFVYIISHPGYPDEYKVGIAKDAGKRLAAYQTADPECAYRIEYKLETPHFRELEAHIHNLFPNKHEWVQADYEDIVREIENYRPEQS